MWDQSTTPDCLAKGNRASEMCEQSLSNRLPAMSPKKRPPSSNRIRLGPALVALLSHTLPYRLGRTHSIGEATWAHCVNWIRLGSRKSYGGKIRLNSVLVMSRQLSRPEKRPRQAAGQLRFGLKNSGARCPLSRRQKEKCSRSFCIAA